jgi:ribosome biogenesis protein ERB1
MGDKQGRSLFLIKLNNTKKINKLVKAIRSGKLKLEEDLTEEERRIKKLTEKRERAYLIWGSDDKVIHPKESWEDNEWIADILRTNKPINQPRNILPAPKVSLPDHSESYCPPTEYLFSEEEKKTWESLDAAERPTNFVPQQFTALRHVSGYSSLLKERFERCLDLFLCPRVPLRKPKGMLGDVKTPEDLLPKLPTPDQLRPFPSQETLVFRGHKDKVRAVAVHSLGKFLLSGSADGVAILWEIATARILQRWDFGREQPVHAVAWHPNATHSICVIAAGSQLHFVNPRPFAHQRLLDPAFAQWWDTEQSQRAEEEEEEEKAAELEKKKGGEQGEPKSTRIGDWKHVTVANIAEDGVFLRIAHPSSSGVIRQVEWHSRGDYVAVVFPQSVKKASQLVIHQLSKNKSQNPFSKKQKGQVQCVLFHPTKPLLFLATEYHIKIYNLAKLMLEKKLTPHVQFISSMDIHTGGDNLLLSSCDKKVCWMDLDLSTKPYKTLRQHRQAVRRVRYHKSYPLFASCSDDNTVSIFHGKVFQDLLQNPLIVPLTILHNPHSAVGNLAILDVIFHPSQPWLFTAGADSLIKLWT